MFAFILVLARGTAHRLRSCEDSLDHCVKSLCSLGKRSSSDASPSRAAALAKLSDEELAAELERLKAGTHWSDYLIEGAKTRAKLRDENGRLVAKILALRKQTDAAVALTTSVNNGLARLHVALEMPSGQRFTCAEGEDPTAPVPPAIVAAHREVSAAAESMRLLSCAVAELEVKMREAGKKRQEAAQIEKRAAARAEAAHVRARFKADVKSMEERRDRAALLHRGGTMGVGTAGGAGGAAAKEESPAPPATAERTATAAAKPTAPPNAQERDEKRTAAGGDGVKAGEGSGAGSEKEGGEKEEGGAEEGEGGEGGKEGAAVT